MDQIFNAFDIMQANVIQNTRWVQEPDIYLRPPGDGTCEPFPKALD